MSDSDPAAAFVTGRFRGKSRCECGCCCRSGCNMNAILEGTENLDVDVCLWKWSLFSH